MSPAAAQIIGARPLYIPTIAAASLGGFIRAPARVTSRPRLPAPRLGDGSVT
jgi:hypothetical protein